MSQICNHCFSLSYLGKRFDHQHNYDIFLIALSSVSKLFIVWQHILFWWLQVAFLFFHFKCVYSQFIMSKVQALQIRDNGHNVIFWFIVYLNSNFRTWFTQLSIACPHGCVCQLEIFLFDKHMHAWMQMSDPIMITWLWGGGHPPINTGVWHFLNK